MPRGDQLSRQWRLLQLIDRPMGMAIEDAAHDLGCTVRTVWRDLRVLEEAGFPIYDEKGADGRRSRWHVSPGFKANLPLKLSLDELAALAMSREFMTPLGASLLGPAVGSAFEKITGILSKDALALLDRMRDTIGVRAVGAKLQQPAADFIPTVQQALVEQRTLRIRYHSFARDEQTEREVDPYHLTYFSGGLYLIAHCHLRRAIRIFAVERIREISPRRTRFIVPTGFDVEGFLARSWGILQGDLVNVKVVFVRAVARYVRERLWHPMQRIRDLSDGRLEFSARVADTLEIRRWILGWGSQAHVVEPASLREAIRVEAEAVARQLTPERRPLASATDRTTPIARSVPQR